MGGGGSSKSSNKTTTTSVSGQNGIQGDNLGASIAGIQNSTVSVQMTDHGAIEKAGQLAELSLTTARDNTNAALENMSGFAGETLKQQALTNSENLQYMAGLAGNQASQNARNLETLKELASMGMDGGQVETSTKMSTLTLAVVLVVGIIAAMAVKGK
ncbi:chemotaxis protein [Vibrio sp. HA2012]|uniref:chemotaxis protein n=1 Tax=Vibrio sp. HA2012 TaxID=1971595 RepID=UPI000C2BCBB0|nr:chemotaxis protein [Vibrio sp. HA2012]PJC85704.1 chemotaxis protein [Vibrio sp. HA2012]